MHTFKRVHDASVLSERKRYAQQRLMKDLAEFSLCSGEFPNVTAAPLEHDIFIWHCNIRGPKSLLSNQRTACFVDCCLHLELRFPETYPAEAPRVLLKTNIKHPNVFGNYICLSMLRPRAWTEGTKKQHEGWSGAYTVCSVLLQLQSFLFAENIPQDYNYNLSARKQGKYRRQNLLNFKCSCGHTGRKPYPAFPSDEKTEGENTEVISEEFRCAECGKLDKQGQIDPKTKDKRYYYCSQCWLDYYGIKDSIEKSKTKTVEKSKTKVTESEFPVSPPENAKTEPAYDMCDVEEEPSSFPLSCVFALIEFLNTHEVYVLCGMYGSWATTVDKYAVQARRNAKCFYTKLDHKEAVLGYGIRVERDPNKPEKIRELACEMELTSAYAYNDLGYKSSAWNHKCDVFVPLVLGREHASKAEALIMDSIADLGGTDSDESILDVMSGLMNSCVVGLMKEEGKIRMYQSEKALEGYSRFHQLFLHMVKLRPGIKKIAEKNIENFIKNSRMRHKRHTPDLGRLLAQLSITDKFSWHDLKQEMFDENTLRNAKWSCEKDPFLRFDCDRRNHGVWYRVYNKVKLYKTASQVDTDEAPERVFKDGTVLFGTLSKDHPHVLKVINPSPGFVSLKDAPSDEIFQCEEGFIKQLPYGLPRLCEARYDLCARHGKSKESYILRTIPKGCFVVVMDIVGNRAKVSFPRGKTRSKQHYARAWSTRWRQMQTYTTGQKYKVHGTDKVPKCLLGFDTSTLQKSREDLKWEEHWVSLRAVKNSSRFESDLQLLEPVEVLDNYRLDSTFSAIEVSRRLLMFQRSFLRSVKNGTNLDEVYNIYLQRFGMPASGAVQRLHMECKTIRDMKTWPEYLHWLGVEYVSKTDLAETLRRSVIRSLRIRYHKPFHPALNDVDMNPIAHAPSYFYRSYARRNRRKILPQVHKHELLVKKDCVSYGEEQKQWSPENYKKKFHVKAEPKATIETRIFRTPEKLVVKEVTFVSVYIPDLPQDEPAKVVKTKLRKLLGKLSIIVQRNKEGNCKGFAFVEFQDMDKAKTIVGKPLEFGGKTVTPKWAKSKKKRPKHRNRSSL